MTSSPPRDLTHDSLNEELADALGAERAELWAMARGPQQPTIRVEYADGRPIAAALTTSRPATAALTIAETWCDPAAPAANTALARIIDQVVVDATTRGILALKWRSRDDQSSPLGSGFVAMRAPYRSAAGTEGVTGHIRWLRPVTHLEPPYYAQTSTFTCGAVTALIASEIRGSGGFDLGDDLRDRELDFWRQASNYPACEPVGLAVALRESLADPAGTAPVEVFVDVDGPVLLEAYPDGFERSFREELQANSLRKALASDVVVNRKRVGIDELAARIQAGELALLLIDTKPMYGFSSPHWVLAHSAEPGVVLIDDPWISTSWGETWVDAHEIPVPLADLDRMVAWGDDGYRGVVFIRRRESQ